MGRGAFERRAQLSLAAWGGQPAVPLIREVETAAAVAAGTAAAVAAAAVLVAAWLVRAAAAARRM